MGHYEVAQMVRRKYGYRVRDLLWARVWQVGSGISFHVEVRRRRQLEDHQNASDVEKGARRRTMRFLLTFVTIVACTISCCFSNAQEIKSKGKHRDQRNSENVGNKFIRVYSRLPAVAGDKSADL